MNGPNFEYITAEKLRMFAVAKIDRRNAGMAHDLEVELLRTTEEMAIRMESSVLSTRANRIEVHKQWPSDWWQAVRERWAPKWWLARHPVVYERIDVSEQKYNICPHIETKMHFAVLKGTP